MSSMTRKPQTTAFWVGRLPHWEVEDGKYFITIHLAGAIPTAGTERLRAIARQLRETGDQHSPNWLRNERMTFREIEKWLDRAEWAVQLRNPDVADMVVEAIDHRQTIGDWDVFEYTIMPTHIHLFCEIGRKGLKTTLEDFKRWTGHQAAKIIAIESERFWQREWFDHWSRSDLEDERIMQYIRNNPVKAGLVTDPVEWRYSSASRRK